MVQQDGDLLTQITYLNTNSGLVQFRPQEEVSKVASASSKNYSTVHQKPKPKPPSSEENSKVGEPRPSGTIKGDIHVGEKQCYCGPAVDTDELLATHKTNIHPTDKSYRCHFCDEEGEGHKEQGFMACWRHVHTKHLKRFHISVQNVIMAMKMSSNA